MGLLPKGEKPCLQLKKCGNSHTRHVSVLSVNLARKKRPGSDTASSSDKSETFSCQQCGKVLTSSYSYSVHLNLHSGEDTLACCFCSARFKHKGSLSRHMRVHSTAEPMRCEYCGKTFLRKYLKRLHIFKRHPESIMQMEPGLVAKGINLGDFYVEKMMNSDIDQGQ